MTTMRKRRLLLSGSGGDLVIPTPVIPSPVLGSERVTNGDFENWTLGNPDGWNVVGESGTDPEISQVGSGELHGGTGTGSVNFYRTSGGYGILRLEQNTVFIGVPWVYVEVDRSAHLGGSYTVADPGQTFKMIMSQARPDLFRLTDRVAANGSLKIVNYEAGDITIDRISIRGLSVPSLISNYSPFGSISRASLKITWVEQYTNLYDAGIIFNLDNPADPKNFLLAYFNGVYTVRLMKCINGVYTLLTSGTVAYAANAELRIMNNLNTFAVYYKNVLVGTPQTVTDISIINNSYCGIFCTSPLMTLRDFRLSA